MSKKTRWFNARTHSPARVGVYEVKPHGPTGWAEAYQFWDGYEWHFRRQTAYEAFAGRLFATTYAFPTWRGLAKKP